MSKREHPQQTAESSNTCVRQVSRGQRPRAIELSPTGFGALVVTAGVAVLGAAFYLAFRDDMLAALLDRQTQMQYAYEDRLAALRLRLDQVTSRQFLDQDGVEGKLQSLVIRQAQLETRAAVVARLMENAGVKDMVSLVPKGLDPERSAFPAAPAARGLPPSASSFVSKDDAPWPFAAKPEPLGMDLRLSHDDDALDEAPPKKNGADRTPIGALPQTAAPGSSLALAGDAELPMQAKLERLALSLDRIEREQTSRLSGLVKPAQDAAGRLQRAFDVAGLPVERYLAKVKKQGDAFVGGLYVPADAKSGGSLFDRELAAAQSAVTTLDGLRRALPAVPLRKPLTGELETTSTFGYRTDPFFGRPALHTGVDLRDDYGAPVRATAAGAIVAAGPNGGYGQMVEIDHGGGMTTRYAHLSSIFVSAGEQIASGAVIGRVGSTGRSTGPHLHYEVRVDGEPVDPARFLRAAATLGGMAQ